LLYLHSPDVATRLVAEQALLFSFVCRFCASVRLPLSSSPHSCIAPRTLKVAILPTTGKRSIAIRVSVCPLAYLKNHAYIPTSPHFLCMLSTVLVRSSVAALRYTCTRTFGFVDITYAHNRPYKSDARSITNLTPRRTHKLTHQRVAPEGRRHLMSVITFLAAANLSVRN